MLNNTFLNHFNVKIATTAQEFHSARAIRYKVFCEELGWEPLNKYRIEKDKYDNYAYHCIIEHLKSGTIVGCVRLVIPSLRDNRLLLPFQTHNILLSLQYHKELIRNGKVGEISRLAVPSEFRYQAKGNTKNNILKNSLSSFSKEEKQHFPTIAIALYLAAIAMVDIQNLDRVFVVMEPRLHRHLSRIGLKFHQISENFEFRGTRALFMLPSHELISNMSCNTLKFYKMIKEKLADTPLDATKISTVKICAS